MKHAIAVLEEAHLRAVERLRSDHSQAAIEEKKEIDRAIAILRAMEGKVMPESFKVVVLEATSFAPFAEYRLLWDCETERRGDWQELALRLSGGDLLITSHRQFAESLEREKKERA